MKHKYKDRFFADPYILDCNDKEIILLCEELIFGHKGMISQLKISRNDFTLIERKVLLKLPSHLSYPAIIENNGKIYVYPENSEAGEIKYYQYDSNSESLIESGIIAKGELTDFTICKEKIDGKYMALSTKLHPDSEENAFQFQSDNLLGPYLQINSQPIVEDRSCSRPGGNFFSVGE